MALLEKILQLDRDLFVLINVKWSNQLFDFILPSMRNANTWIPFYVFLLIYMSIRHKKRGWIWILLAILTVAITDPVSSRLIKDHIFRVRPCGDKSLAGHIHFLVSYCPQSSSFTSSHAANHFGMATFFYFTLRGYYGMAVGLIFLWAFIVCYAQIYVGVHFPLDIIGGALVGAIIGFFIAQIFNKYSKLEK